MEPTDVNKYINMAKRRKYWIIIPFLFTLLAGLSYLLIAPKLYEAETLILVQPQKVPEDFVRAIVSGGVEDRLQTITQQVTSRTNLEKIINEYQVYSTENNNLDIDEKVSFIRKMIRVDVSKGGSRNSEASAFTIAFQNKDPVKAMQVTNALASGFITENLKIRESQALGTSTFLADELESVKTRLLEKEKGLKDYREQYMGGLPEQLQTNLSILERLQSQVDQQNNNLRDAENRRIVIQTQIADQARMESVPVIPSTDRPRELTDLQSLKFELANLEARYTDKHPDIRRLKETIAKLENQQVTPATTSGPYRKISNLSGVELTLKQQLQNLDLEIASLKEEIKETRSQIDVYQKKIEDTPKREQELLSLNRDYNNLKEVYNSLLNRKLEAEIAVSMEKKQKGEQFRIIDPAKVPIRPIKPDMKKIGILVILLGLGLGVGLAYVNEMMDTSYKMPEELEAEVQLPLLVSLPIRYTKEETKRRSRIEFFKGFSVTICFILSAAGIILSVKGVDATLNYVKTLLSDLGVL